MTPSDILNLATCLRSETWLECAKGKDNLDLLRAVVSADAAIRAGLLLTAAFAMTANDTAVMVWERSVDRFQAAKEAHHGVQNAQ